MKTQELNELVASCDNRILIGLARLPGLDTRLLGVHRTELRVRHKFKCSKTQQHSFQKNSDDLGLHYGKILHKLKNV